MITLQPRPDGSGIFTEPGTDVTWVRDSYTEPREAEFECTECGELIEDWHFFTCMDGGEAAHQECVTVEYTQAQLDGLAHAFGSMPPAQDPGSPA